VLARYARVSSSESSKICSRLRKRISTESRPTLAMSQFAYTKNKRREGKVDMKYLDFIDKRAYRRDKRGQQVLGSSQRVRHDMKSILVPRRRDEQQTEVGK
jgi:hypothetical protein